MDYKKIGVQALAVGVVAKGLMKVAGGGSFPLEYFSVSMQSDDAIAVACAVSSVVSDVGNGWVIQKLGINPQVQNAAAMAVQAAVPAAAATALLYFGAGSYNPNFMSVALVAAGSKYAGDWVADRTFGPNAMITRVF